MARKRKYTNRQDYRKGGRVRRDEEERKGYRVPHAHNEDHRADDPNDESDAERRARIAKENAEAAAAARAAQQKDIYSEGTQTAFDTARTEAESIKAGTSTFAPPAPVKDLDTGKASGVSSTETQTGSEDIVTVASTGTGAATTDADDVTMDTAQVTDPAAQAQEQDVKDAATYTAKETAQAPVVNPATGELSPEAQAQVDEIRELSGPAAAAKFEQDMIEAAKATTIDGVISSNAYVPEVTGIGGNLSDTPDAEKQTRNAITGSAADDEEAAQIIKSVGYEAAQRQTVKGTARTSAAAKFVAETANLAPEIAAAITTDPVTVEAQIANEDVEVQAAVAALPQEALVSSQNETLVGGLESGTIPIWAKPAVDAINQRMASRGLSVSTVGRDALFNAIIQSALPIAQSNAQALQARAAQNLSNQQQANLTEATQEQQLRMANLANRQGAATQTAQFAQQIATQARGFQQQASLANLEAEREIVSQNLANEQQIELANLQAEVQRVGADQSAVNQERLSEMQIAAQFLSQNANLRQDMAKANLSAEQQIKLANLSAQNQASSEILTAAQQTELANLNKNMQMNIKNAELAQQLGLSQLNVDQQRAMANANMVAGMDMAKFNNDQQVQLANSKFMQTTVLADFNAEQQSIMQNATAMASLDLATADQRTRLAITNAQSFLQMDMAELSNQQQANMLTAQQTQQRLLSDSAAENAARQFGATSENQTNQFMASMAQQIELSNQSANNAQRQFNVQQANALEAQRAGIQADVDKANAAMRTQVSQFNAQKNFDRQKWNAANAQAVEQSNVAWRRQANTINTAAANQASMQNAQNLFGMSAQAQAFMWQELRDRASYEFQAVQKYEDRKAALIAQGLGNEAASGANYSALASADWAAIIGTLGSVYIDATTTGE